MVSKFIKKTPTKITKPRRRRSSSASAAVISSLLTCHRRLVKLFHNLARVSTPHRRRHGFKILKKTESSRRVLFTPAGAPLPPAEIPGKKTVVLDLDETMVHAQAGAPPEKYDFIVRPIIDGIEMEFYVLKRPGVENMLEKIAEKYEVVVFTAGLREYASLVLDRLDRKRVVSHRLYRDSCKEMEGRYVKDLASLGRDLRRVVIVDDNPNSYSLQPENGVPVKAFVDDVADREMWKLVEFFEGEECEDMREAVKEYAAAFATAETVCSAVAEDVDSKIKINFESF